MDNAYEILGVTPDASQADLKVAYHRLAKQYHPDRNPGDKEAADFFALVTDAWSKVGTVDKRRAYDWSLVHPGVPRQQPNDQPPPQPQPRIELEISPSILDFGMLNKTQSAIKTVTVRLAGPNRFSRIRLEWGSPTPDWARLELKRTETGQIRMPIQINVAVFTSHLEYGRYITKIVLHADDTAYEIPITMGIVETADPPRLVFNRGTINLGAFRQDETAGRIVTIDNTGGPLHNPLEFSWPSGMVLPRPEIVRMGQPLFPMELQIVVTGNSFPVGQHRIPLGVNADNNRSTIWVYLQIDPPSPGWIDPRLRPPEIEDLPEETSSPPASIFDNLEEESPFDEPAPRMQIFSIPDHSSQSLKRGKSAKIVFRIDSQHGEPNNMEIEWQTPIPDWCGKLQVSPPDSLPTTLTAHVSTKGIAPGRLAENNIVVRADDVVYRIPVSVYVPR